MNEMSLYKRFLKSSHFSGVNAEYLEELYEKYLNDPSSIDPQWKTIFMNMSPGVDVSHDQIRHNLMVIPKRKGGVVYKEDPNNELRAHGHLYANTNPLYAHSLNESRIRFPNVSDAMLSHYCGVIGYEYTYIDDKNERQWLQRKIENNTPSQVSDQQRMTRYQIMYQASELERYLGRKFVGQKRFSLEGNESMIVLVDALLNQLADDDVSDVVIGMAHRGRLNVLVNTLGLSVSDLVERFEGTHSVEDSSGDVKYHLGYSSDRLFKGKQVHISLGYNPSHLEAIAPVVHGNTRARQFSYQSKGLDRNKAIAVIMHGDSALIGQGIVMEGLNQSQTPAYETGGSVHIVINNQIGFTTIPTDGRSSRYCTDVAKVIQAPVFHVNADDVDAVAHVAQLAAQYRKKFSKDVFINLMGYRKHGHNEADEPSGTQPEMYALIKKKKGADQIYRDQCLSCSIPEADLIKIESVVKEKLKNGEQMIDVLEYETTRFLAWQNYQGDDWRATYPHRISKKQYEDIKAVILSEKEGFTYQKQVKMLVNHRAKMLKDGEQFNWGLSELMAYVYLMQEGFNIRLIGQDTCRGTFAHRHAVYHDHENGELYTPLRDGAKGYNGNAFNVYNSVLSEYAALGFEYGYAETSPKTLVIWEAQFGDFVNGAQIVIDQFISSGWRKWGRMCGLVMYLPHGYEGMGPEHTSARLERFMQMCAENNMQVCVPSTPAQMFHLLVRQMKRNYRRPLIVITPKSLLRHHEAVSSYKEHESGVFRTVIEDECSSKKEIDRVVLCSGKVYYQLREEREKASIDTVHFIRLEQLYPFPYKELKTALKKFKNAKIIWCQEEPFNQGAWLSIQFKLNQCTSGGAVYFAGRESSAAPAVGYIQHHQTQQIQLVQQALGLISNPYEEENHEYRD